MGNPAPAPPPPPRPAAPPRPTPPPPPPPPAPRRGLRESSALNIAPLFLRIAVAATFIWTGLGKVLTTFPVQGADALTLYNLGVIEGPAPRAAAPTAPAPASPAPESQPQNPGTPQNIPPGDAPGGKPGPTASLPGRGTTSLVRFQPAARTPHLASDFDAPIEVSTLHRTTLMLAAAASPSVAPDGKSTLPPILPAWMGSDPWARVLAWTAVVSELLGGAFILFGLITRLWALLLAGTVGMSIWLTEIGPAIRDGNALLGFLPAGRPTFDLHAWMPLLWLFALLCACLSLLCSGAGSLSLDRGLFRRRRHDDDD